MSIQSRYIEGQSIESLRVSQALHVVVGFAGHVRCNREGMPKALRRLHACLPPLAAVLALRCTPSSAPPYAGFVDAPVSAVASQLAGKVVSIPVREGDHVKKGDVLAQLESSVQEAAVAEAETNVDRARQALKEAEATTVTCVTSSIVMTISMLATGVRIHGGWEAYVLVAAVVVLTALGMLAMTMALLGRASHPRIVGSVNGFLNIILFFPSGALYPVQSFPGWLRAFARINPEMHAVAALKAVLFRGGDLVAARGHVVFLLGFTAVMLLVSTVTMKRTL